jgi:hypothetical protein
VRSRLTQPVPPTLVMALVGAIAALFLVPALGAAKSPPVIAPKIDKVTVSPFAATGTTVTVAGHVILATNTAAERRRTRVILTLRNGAGATERHTVTITAKRAFTHRWKTRLTGKLTLSVTVTISGRRTGKTVTKAITITDPNAPRQLIGTFRLTAGAAPAGGSPTGTYFEMLTSTGAPLGNLSSPAPNKNYTPLSPGTDGGLRTVAYQPGPSPAFAGGNSGGALASAIIAPVPFYGVNFSVATAQTDAQLGTRDPLPVITARGRVLTGQISAWVAQWNGQSFNQGTPKPDGTLPAPTTALSGSYDPATKAFVLVWKSAIVGGPFNGFTGLWHLQGTFVPAPTRATT